MMRFAISAAVLLSSVVAVSAASPLLLPPAKVNQKPPCVAEVQKFCSDVPLGNGGRIACLEQHNAQLSPVCRERTKALRAMFDFGQAQHRKTMVLVAKQHAEAADKKKSAPSSKASIPPPAQ